MIKVKPSGIKVFNPEKGYVLTEYSTKMPDSTFMNIKERVEKASKYYFTPGLSFINKINRAVIKEKFINARKIDQTKEENRRLFWDKYYSVQIKNNKLVTASLYYVELINSIKENSELINDKDISYQINLFLSNIKDEVENIDDIYIKIGDSHGDLTDSNIYSDGDHIYVIDWLYYKKRWILHDLIYFFLRTDIKSCPESITKNIIVNTLSEKSIVCNNNIISEEIEILRNNLHLFDIFKCELIEARLSGLYEMIEENTEYETAKKKVMIWFDALKKI
ncbi:hypothetical protein [Alkalicoccus chagannorensis]|uniref:hypothetical protein n=1 Tax=Alkalicoccus chagannorensis TaxID=427072 RepID=UPI0012EBA101|nr:hypothetical protein [Alkalicoccus chagannorensis]